MNKKAFAIATAGLIVFLAVFLPLASSNPDGLEKVVETFDAEEQEPFWKGLMGDYSVSGISDPYVTTLIAGVAGTVIVFVAGLLLGKTMSRKAQ